MASLNARIFTWKTEVEAKLCYGDFLKYGTQDAWAMPDSSQPLVTASYCNDQKWGDDIHSVGLNEEPFIVQTPY